MSNKNKLSEMPIKCCSKCKRILPSANFHKNRGTKDGLRFSCKECHNSEMNAYYKANRKERLIYYHTNREKSIAYYNTHRKEYLTCIQSYRRTAKGKEVQRKAAYKQRSTSSGRLNDSMSVGILRSLHDLKANRHWEGLVGYTVDRLKKHLEKQFTLGMTWENYGPYWHIDHKIPKTVFNFKKHTDPDFKKCWALKNLQPLEKIENIKKGAKLNKPFQPSLAF
uniref:Putative HNH endonuclease n=1 Tax=viral metagenome TaxID=1070528 RepID=A0A6H1ZXQ5_9ZZZZ